MNLLDKIKLKLRLTWKSVALRSEVLEAGSFAKYYLSQPKNGHDVMQVKAKNFPRPIYIRKSNPVDVAVIKYVFFQKFHLPPPQYKMPANPIILDLGSNIGLTINHLKSMYPGSTILGFEMDSDNYAMAVRNCEGLADVKVFNNAVWKESSTVAYDKSSQTDAYKVGSAPASGASTVQSITIDDIIKNNNLPRVDFLKMDIEGAELEIFNSGKLDWLDKVQSLNIEFHDLTDEELNEKVKILENKGFHAWKDEAHWCLIKAYK